MQHLVVGFAGLSRSGKTFLSTTISGLLGWPRASFGDQVRKVATARGVDTDLEQLLEIGDGLVTNDCEQFCRDVLGAIKWDKDKSVILDGVRHSVVVDTVQGLISPQSFRLVFVETPFETRDRRFREKFVSSGITLSGLDHSIDRDAGKLRLMADLIVDGNPGAATKALQGLLKSIQEWGN